MQGRLVGPRLWSHRIAMDCSANLHLVEYDEGAVGRAPKKTTLPLIGIPANLSGQ